MRLAHVHMSYANLGGVERYLHTTLPILEHAGVENAVFYARRSGNEPSAPWPVMHVPELASEPGARLLDRRRAVAQALRSFRPDVVLLHHLLDSGTAEWFGDEAPVAQFVHSQFPFVCPGESKYLKVRREVCTRAFGPFCVIAPWVQQCSTLRPLRHLSMVVNTRRYLAHAVPTIASFVVASRYMRDELLLNDYPADRIALVPLGTEVPGGSDPAPPPDVSPSDPRPVVLSAGRVTRHKGVDLLVNAMDHVGTPAHLVIVGSGDGVADVQRALRSLPERHAASMLGALEPGVLARWYDRASVVVVPSIWAEPFGLVGIEAMARGRPVVAFDRGGIRDWLDHCVTGLSVPPGDVGAMGAAIDALLADPGRARSMGDAALRRVRAEFTLDRHAARLIEVLSRLPRAGAVAS